MTVSFDLIAQRTHHLAMADVTPFADVNFSPGQLERRIRPHAIDFLNRAFKIKQRRNLDDAADGNSDEDRN